ncbi:MAG: DUF6531 domain-containing protein, partial [Betaproteobacteria bacterium]
MDYSFGPAGNCYVDLWKRYGPGCGTHVVGISEEFAPCPSVFYYDSNIGKCRLRNGPPNLDPGRRGGQPSCRVGNPCDPGTGNKYEEEVDYEASGPFPLRFVRAYNSVALETGSDGSLGPGWESNHHGRLVSVSAAVSGTASTWAFLTRPDGAGLSYR